MSARRALAGAVVLALLAACAPSGYQAYRDAHPGWDGAFPTSDADLTRVFAALAGPPARGHTTTAQQEKVWRLDAGHWVATDPSAAPASGDSVGVTALLECVADDGQSPFLTSQQNWYLLREGRLVAWDHHQFTTGCTISDDFSPAKADLAPVEQELLERAGLCRPACAAHAVEYYAKGQAFVRAGRLADAQEMLARGDGSGASGFDARQRFSDSRGPVHASESAPAAAREALVRELDSAPK